jgi:hypothetical protein
MICCVVFFVLFRDRNLILSYMLLFKNANFKNVLKVSDDGVLHSEESCFGLCPLSDVSKKHNVSGNRSISVLR